MQFHNHFSKFFGCALRPLPLESEAHCQEQAESAHALGTVHGHLAVQSRGFPTDSWSVFKEFCWNLEIAQMLW